MTHFDTYRALSFDCYGTLIDWETGILQALQPWCAWRGIDVPAEELLELPGGTRATSRPSGRRRATPRCSPRPAAHRRLARWHGDG